MLFVLLAAVVGRVSVGCTLIVGRAIYLCLIASKRVVPGDCYVSEHPVLSERYVVNKSVSMYVCCQTIPILYSVFLTGRGSHTTDKSNKILASHRLVKGTGRKQGLLVLGTNYYERVMWCNERESVYGPPGWEGITIYHAHSGLGNLP